MSGRNLNSESSKNENTFIESLWIIERESGTCIFEQNFGDIKQNNISIDLICEFFSAVSMLALELFSEDINYIKLSKNTFAFKYTKNFLLIISIRNKNCFNSHKIRIIINKILENFILLSNKNFQNWDINILQFKSFSKCLENQIC